MALNTKERKGIVYFTGYEVEHTICHGMKTLFVVGTPPLNEILEKANEFDCKHIYFGTSQSFNPDDNSEKSWEPWDVIITGCLRNELWVTLDFDVKYTEGVHQAGYCFHQKFVPMISVKLPYIKSFNYNATLKLDDITWGKTNSGVWTHQLNELMTKEKYTYWDQYQQDTKID